MNGILIDNWNLQEIFYSMCKVHNPECNEAYRNLLSTIVLWDDIYYPKNDMSFVWATTQSNLLKVMQPYDDSEHLFDQEATEIYHKICDTDKNHSVIGQGAIRYQLLSNHLGLSYLPASQRADFLIRHNYTSITRLNINNIVDSMVEEELEPLGKKADYSSIMFETPLLSDYIIYNTNDSSSHIDCALQLKNEKSVKRYRDYLSKIEEKAENGDKISLMHFERDIQELIEDVKNLDRKFISSIGCSILPMPSINFTGEITFKRPKRHLTFARHLIKYSFSK